jgi:hypothetical protein
MLERLEGARLAVSARARLALWHGRRQLAGGGMVSTYSRTGPRWHHVHTEQGHVDHFTREGGNDVEGVAHRRLRGGTAMVAVGKVRRVLRLYLTTSGS